MASKKNLKFVYWQTIIISSLLLGSLLLVAIFGGNRLAEMFPQFGGGVRTGLMLFVLWLMVSTGIRSISSLIKKSTSLELLVAGSVIGILGSVTCFSLAKVVAFFREGSTLHRVFDHQNVLFFAGVGIVLAILTTINLQTKNRALGNLLEFLVIAAVILGIIYFKQ